MSPSAPIVCTHDRGPGTTMCLRCRYEERRRAQQRMMKLLLQGTAAALAAAVVVALVVGGIGALRKRGPASAASDVAATAVNTAVAPAVDVPPPVTPVETTTTPPPTATGAVPPRASAVEPAIAPGVPMGRTALSDTVFVMRTDSGVRVVFDAGMGRTRRHDKFELMVRSTLPRVYGAAADSALQRLALGSLGREGDLVNELPTRGIRLPAAGGATIVIWPETRAGRDGPLVVSYRVTTER
jgi:hypothetical protein